MTTDTSTEAIKQTEADLRKWDYPQSTLPVFGDGTPLVRIAADQLRALTAERDFYKAYCDGFEAGLTDDVRELLGDAEGAKLKGANDLELLRECVSERDALSARVEKLETFIGKHFSGFDVDEAMTLFDVGKPLWPLAAEAPRRVKPDARCIIVFADNSVPDAHIDNLEDARRTLDKMRDNWTCRMFVDYEAIIPTPEDAIAKAREEERERCAKIADADAKEMWRIAGHQDNDDMKSRCHARAKTGERIAAAIRSQGEG